MATPPGTARKLSDLYDLFNDAQPTGPRNTDVRDAIATLGERQPKNVNAAMSPYQAQEVDGLILVDASGGAVEIDLAVMAVMAKLEVIVKKTDATGNAVTVKPAPADAGVTIDGGASVQTAVQNASIRCIADGNN